MAMVDPTVAGLASVHGRIGAVDPVRTFGTPEQNRRFAAAGQRRVPVGFRPDRAGLGGLRPDVLRTVAVKEGDSVCRQRREALHHQRDAGTDRIGLVCLIDDRPAVLVVELPAEREPRTSAPQVRSLSGKLKHTHNQGIVFNNFRVPAENLLQPVRGDGLTIAYHGLNLGRVALCANASGVMRTMMASMVPWARFRVTYSEPIARRELVQRRLGELAGLITACDADWSPGARD